MSFKLKDNKYEMFGHTIEPRISPTGSVDPWTLDYASTKKVGIMCTSDMGFFILVDDMDIYKIECSGIRFMDMLESVESWNDALALIDRYKRGDFGTIEDSKKNVDDMEAHNERIKNMSKEELREYHEKLKEERKKKLNRGTE